MADTNKADRCNQLEPLAIVGAACRFPGNVTDLASFWRLLANGEDAITELPPERCSLERFFSNAADMPGHAYTRAAGVIYFIKSFDPGFFGFSRKEAMDMEPQQRLILETAWEAIEAAGLRASALRGSRAGVFVGASNMDYTARGAADTGGLGPYSMTGSSLSIIANRVSYTFDLHGPSLVVDTACSSSMVALHSACEALRRGEIPLALVGGVNVLLSPLPFIGFSKAHMLSPDGRCKVFDASGNGYVRSEGAGMIVIKPLRQAKKDKDNILALIAGTGVNSDGRTTGLALPNQKAQAALLREIYERFELDKGKLAYVEAHGTGTAAGDPLEAGAVGEVLGKPLRETRSLHIGSVKSNIGHLEPASGMAGIIKALLVLQNGQIPPNLHFNTPNPAIDFAGLNLTVPTKLTPLPQCGKDALVSVNSFGFGGTNAHVVLQKAPAAHIAAKTASESIPPLFLSARSEKSLRGQALDLAEHLKGADAATCRDAAATLACCRDHLRFRAIVADVKAETLSGRLHKLGSLGEDGAKNPPVLEGVGENCRGAFVFSGNGGQWSGMGAALLKSNRDFAQAIREVDGCLTPLRQRPLLAIMENPEQYPTAHAYTEDSQPLLFALQVGLVRALAAKGITPDAVFGHSVGEVAAAWACGALSLKDACTVIHFRSLLQARLRGVGGMAVANISRKEAEKLLEPYEGRVEIAAVNTAQSLTLSGETEPLAQCVQAWKKRRISAKMLDLPYPFHTRLLDYLQGELLEALKGIKPQKPAVPYFSTVDSIGEKPFLPDAAYWWRNLRKPVQFYPAANKALEQDCRIFLEIGPHRVLHGYLQEIVKQSGVSASVLSTLHRNGNDAERFETAWKEAWQRGWTLNTKAFVRAPFKRRVLPPYAWNREHLWTPDSPECREFLGTPRLHPLLGWRLPLAAPAFENVFSLPDYPWLADHKAGEGIPFPAAGFLEMMLAAGGALHPDEQVELERVAIFRPMRLSVASAQSVRLLADQEDGGLRLEGRAYMSREDWTQYCRARLAPATHPTPSASTLVQDPEQFGAPVERDSLYATAEQYFLHYGPAFRTVEKAWLRQGKDGPEVLAKFGEAAPESASGMLVPPTLVDGAFHTLFLLLRSQQGGVRGQAFLPAAFGRVILYERGTPVFAHARLRRIGPRSVVADFDLLDSSGKPLLSLRQCRFRRAFWLEGEMLRPSAYVFKNVPLPGPDPDQASPFQGSLASLCQSAHKAMALNLPENGQQHEIHPRLLLRFAALTHAHETMLALAKKAPTPGRFTCDELVASGIVAARHKNWVRQMLLRLSQADLARQEDDCWIISPPNDRPSAVTLWRTVIGNAPGCLPGAALLSHVMERTPAILACGEDSENPLTGRALFTEYFSSSPALQPFTRGLAECLLAVLNSRRTGQTVRVLQTAVDSRRLAGHLLHFVAGTSCRYDVAEKDASEAKSLDLAFASTPEARALHLDLGQPPQELAGGYHLILADFSLHGLDNAQAVLANCHALLAPGGILCLLEHQPDTFTDLTFGADPAWWLNADDAAPDSRFYPREAWLRALEQAGFAETMEAKNPEGNLTPAFLLLARKAAGGEAVPPAPPEQRTFPEEPETGSVWLLIAREKDSRSGVLARNLEKELKSNGREVRLIYAGVPLHRGGRDFDPLSTAHWRDLFGAAPKDEQWELVDLLGYDCREAPEPAEFASLMNYGASSAAALASAWDSHRCKARLWLLCSGAQPAGTDDLPLAPHQGALWGFGRVLMNEMPALRTTLLDIHGPTPDAARIIREMLNPTENREIILAGGRSFTPRLVRADNAEPRRAGAGNNAARLTFDSPGRLQNLYWQRAATPTPEPDQVRIAVKAVGLNFRDVMWSMGLLLDEALENGFSGPGMGIECSGIIEAVGENVAGLEVGDAVLAFAPSCFSTHVVTSAAAVLRKPKNLTFAEAATIPVAFMTAWYSIKHLAAMQPGERILIHGAAGGVGLAAIQTAALLGLEIYATAGSPAKHDFLRQLGVKHLFSSRSLAFAQQVMDATNGQGVDVVLNSLAGEAIPAGISVLKPFGRFLELGKRDFYADSPLRLQPFSNNISFFGIDVDQLLCWRPQFTMHLFQELMEQFAKGRLRPLPHACYSRVQTVEAFQTMQQSSHIGKLVVLMDDKESDVRPLPRPKAKLRLRADATYLVTGGTDGFGLATADRLALRGARHLVLLSRSGVKTQQAASNIESMREAGVKVTVAKANVADAKALKNALKAALKDAPPLAGIVHAAAVLDDGVITGLTPERLERVLAAKALGAWNLHMATQTAPLDFFVLYSSVSAAFGNPGQANYVAANCVLENLAAARRQKGLPATVIGWGPVADTGMLQGNLKVQAMLKSVLGVGSLTAGEALDWLEQCLVYKLDASHYFGMDWQKQSPLASLSSSRFELLLHNRGKKAGADLPPLELIRSRPPEEALSLLTEILRAEIADILCLPAERLAVDASIAAEGMDSLMAMELGMAIDQKFSLDGYTIPLSDKTTTMELAKALYPVIMSHGGAGEESEASASSRAIEAMSRQHAVRLPDDVKKELESIITRGTP